ncbi:MULTISPECIES: copper resistance protein B [Acidobacterium]|uniref:Copper resistance protein B n=1 Tax=Acidobacterium capsulatum (strain ATCC 51196 / DSM 11244 / BCRC 80197 / JCM 7670 / NBRC 15755 / NCIMB 13165 / 161) TaxID=240015 RepID=C1F1R5_ACIC5|nr:MULTISPECIES: copper resistance protein B [Acidobacterium]ACO32952.1 copper resistance protein B [Acidobacterium capsulatum ATCC 51196]
MHASALRTARRASVTVIVLFLALAGSQSFAQQSHDPYRDASGKVTAMIPGAKDSMGGHDIFTHVLFDQFEGRTNGPDNAFRWDGQIWSGTDFNKLWIKTEGTAQNGLISDGDDEFLYDRPIPRLRYLDAQAGLRADLDSGPTRTWAALGVEGLAPYGFDLEPTLYWRNGGHLAGRINAAYEFLLTQRLILEPQAELNFYSKDDPARHIGSGFSDLDGGLRLRYEIRRKFAPYVGFAYSGKFGNSARYAMQSGESTRDPRFVFGIRMWY